MLRFSANLGFLWAELPLLERFDAAARAGFRAVELHWPYDVPALELADAIVRSRLTLLGINTAPGRFEVGERGLGAVPGRERDFQATVDQAIDYCRAAGGSAIHAMAGVVPGEDRERARETFLENLRVAAPRAAAAGLTLLL
ncbi:MAG TPA: TIM barrel protein, partial [Steroidobacteraceae bacterium]|nr:TIM barrel protein [Steroidobacteraceae bacterium]